jgi:hypothetical protein
MARIRIPKRVGDVKIPKKVRRKAKRALRMAENPAVREFAAAALDAAAKGRARRTVAGATLRIDGDRLADTIRHAALDGLRRFMEGFEEGLREAEAKGSARRPARPPATAAAAAE